MARTHIECTRNTWWEALEQLDSDTWSMRNLSVGKGQLKQREQWVQRAEAGETIMSL